MTASYSARRGLSLPAWLLLILVLLLVGAGAAAYALAQYPAAARFLGVTSATPAASIQALPGKGTEAGTSIAPPAIAGAQQVAVLEARLARLENATRQTAGSAGRADALLIAFAARRAVDRGVPLGYLEPLLAERFGANHRPAVATIITASRSPVRLDQLQAEFEALAPTLQRGGPEEGLWDGFRRELGSLVSIRRADRPSPRSSATVERASARLQDGQVDQALAEAMRLPGIGRAGGWVERARRYVAAHRALDEIESAALLGGSR